MKHKPIKKIKPRFIQIGAKTYSIIEEIEPELLKVKLVKFESKFGTKINDATPFVMNVSKLNYQIKENE